MAVCGYNRNIEYAASPEVSFSECHGTSCKECTLCKQLINRTKEMLLGLPTFRAHSTLSNLAPVFQKRLNHTRNGSSQAVILLASSGTSNRCNSESVRVQTSAAIRPPAEVPVMTRGINFASRKAFTTPQWSSQIDYQHR